MTTGRCEKCGNPFDDHILPVPDLGAQPKHRWAYPAQAVMGPICVKKS